MLNPMYLATAAAIVAGLLTLLQSRVWPLTSQLIVATIRSMLIAFIIVWLFATLYNHLMLTSN